MLSAALMFRDGMVLQRDKPVAVWGRADAGAQIRVSMQGRTARCQADAAGAWFMTCGPFRASAEETMCIASQREELVLRDVAVGDVWLAGGQSNMEFPMRFDAGLATEKDGRDPQIRFFDYPEVSYPGQIDERDYAREYGRWRKAGPEDIQRFSAVAYYFAKKVRADVGVPIGILGCNWGGSPACAWMPEEDIVACGAAVWLEEYRAATASLDTEAYARTFRGNPGNYHVDLFAEPLYDILQIGYPSEVILQKAAALGIAEEDMTQPMGPLHEWRPTGLYHSMLRQVAPYGLRGFLWYQGEADDTHAELYHRVFPALIRRWRALWGEDLPFLFVQLAPFGHWLACRGTRWPEVRAAQQWVADNVPGTAMAVITDAGVEWDIHPKDKRPAGERLALLAERYAYGMDILCEAPRMAGMEVRAGQISLRFDHAGLGLILDGGRLDSLEIYQNGSPVPWESCFAQADRLIVTGAGIQAGVPTEARLAWRDYYRVNLKNSAGIPARPAIVHNNNANAPWPS